MGLEFRIVEPGELETYVRLADAGFGARESADRVRWLADCLTGCTCRAAFDGATMVATSLDYRTSMGVPGDLDVPVVAVTWVTTAPTHRRRGAMRGLIEATLAEAREDGVDRAVLWVSQFGIYGRFGFGPATQVLNRIEVDTAHSAFAVPFADPGRMRFVENAEALELLPRVYESARRGWPGDVLRHEGVWRAALTDPKRTDRFTVVHEDGDGSADGYARYRYQHAWSQGVPQTVVECEDLVWHTSDAHGALWRFLLDLDLVATVDVELRPLDDPIRWRLADPRRARFGFVQDALWVSLLDVPRALARRRYAADGALVLEVEGQGLLLESADGVAACRSTDRDPDLVLDRQTLAACHLGGHRFSELASARLVEERTPGGLARADLMFQAERAPWCSAEF